MSGTSVTPPWLKIDVNNNAPVTKSSSYSPVPVTSYVPQPTGVPSTLAPQQSGSPLPPKLTTVLFTVKIITILLCILMDATAVIGIGYISQVDEVGQFFVAAYMLFFATILMAFEIISFRRVEWIDHWFRRNCGFLYNPLGKALFIIFIAFLSFGLGNPATLTLSTGLALAAFGSLQVGLYLKYPEMFEERVETVPATVSL